MTISKREVAHSVAWSSAANWGSQLVSFGVYTGLARLLDPRIFGSVAIAGVYVAFMQVFVNQGFGTALVQREDLDPEHVDSAFWINMVMAILLGALSILFEGQIARLFHEPSVAPVIGWLAVSFPLFALSSTPNALLTRDLKFRVLAVRGLASTVIGGVAGLAMAFLGFGVWSLVGQQLVGAVFGVVFLWSTVEWRPGFKMSKRHLRDLYGFSLNLTLNDILWFFSQRSDSAIVGYGFGAVGLGPYSLASRLNNLLLSCLGAPLQQVALPALSKIQSDRARIERAVAKFCEVSSLVSLPIFAGLFVTAPQAVPVLFGAKWVAAVPIVQALAAYAAIRSLFTFMDPLMLAVGRSGAYLILFVGDAALTVCACLVGIRWSPLAVAISMVFSISVLAVVSFVVIQRLLHFQVGPLLRAFSHPILASCVMVIVVRFLREFLAKSAPPLVTLSICCAAGIAVYFLIIMNVKPTLIREIWHSFAPKRLVETQSS
jgi:O-antigen/teichoic acid export membrane protein